MMYLEMNKSTGFFTSCFENNEYVGELVHVHPERACDGRSCAIHARPSNHPLFLAPMVWREDRSPQILERLCTHGIGHPDFDSAAYLISVGQAELNVHGCDGCCRS